MAIDISLLVSAPILQDYFSDNATDVAMSAGVITCYKDNSRTTLKNWYYQTGQPGSYTYTQLPNPLTLSAAGTITDAMGNDTIPFWYPYSEVDNTTFEPYYVTVDNSNGQRQFTRQNFPFVAEQGSVNNATLRNLIVNNVFWRNTESVTLTAPSDTFSLNSVTYYSNKLAPSQHDGFVGYMSDIIFAKNATGATDVATFSQFPSSGDANARLTGDATPEYYLNMSCTNNDTSASIKYIQIPICLHVDNLSDYPTAIATIWTQTDVPSVNNTITLKLFQFLGTGTTSPAASTLVTISPSTKWQKTDINFAFPPCTFPPGGPGDDGWFLQIGLPTAVAYNMNIAKPSIYLGDSFPSDDFDTYEFVSGTIDSPRTGDIRTSLNTYYPFGWVPLNDGTIGSVASNANARRNKDTWPLFDLLWQAFHLYTSGTVNSIAQMVDSSGANVAYGSTAIADWNANRAIKLTKTMGKVILGTVPLSSVLNSPFAALMSTYSTTMTASNNAGNLTIVTGNTVNYFNGMPVYVTTTGTLPDSLTANTIYYIAGFNGTNTFNLSRTFADAIARTLIAYGATSGSNCSIVGAVTATSEGEYGHTQLVGEVGPIVTSAADAGAQVHIGSGTGGPPTNTTATGTAFNITQPGTFYNMYMKL